MELLHFIGKSTCTVIRYSRVVPVSLWPFNVVIEQQVLMIVLFRKQMDNVRLQLIIHLNVQPSRTARIQGLKSKGKRERYEKLESFLWFLKGKFLGLGPEKSNVAEPVEKCQRSRRPKGWWINLMQHEFPNKLSPPQLSLPFVILLVHYLSWEKPNFA